LAVLGALACGGAVILWAGHGTTFREDEWAFVATRLGGNADAYLQPHNEHLLLLPVVVFKALFAIVGLAHYWPYRVAVVIVHLVCVALLFVVVERRRGAAIAAIAAAPILVLGSSSEVLLFPIDLGFAGSMAAGLGALLALDARSRRGDLVLCLMLVLALASSGLGLSIVLGVLVELTWDRDRWRRAWVVVPPLALYGLWVLAYNLHPDRQGPLVFGDAPRFTVRVAGAAVAGLLGIPEYELADTRLAAWPARIGIAIVLASAAALAVLVLVKRRLTPRLALLIVTLGSYWALVGVSRAYTSAPAAPRYIYAAAVLVVLIAVEATRTLAIPRPVVAGLALAAVGATALNVHWLFWNGDRYRSDSRQTEAELGALEVARGEVGRHFQPISRPAYPLEAEGYFHATDELAGSVATPADRLPALPEPDREAADSVLIRGTVSRLSYTPAVRRFQRGSGVPERHCVARSGPVSLVPAPSGLVVRSDGVPVRVALRRFGSGFQPLATVTGGPELLVAPSGHARTPWRVQLTAPGPFRTC
jgi:hypothetical protein